MEILSLIISVIMGGTIILLENYPSTAAYNSLGLKYGKIDCRILPIFRIKLGPQDGALVPTIPIRSGEEVSRIPQASPILPRVVPLTPVLIF